MARTVADSVTIDSPTRARPTLPPPRALSVRPSRVLTVAARDQCLVFVVASAVYIAIALFWVARGMNPIGGDEPHYLVAAQAMTNNHSLDLRPVYELPAWAWLPHEGAHVVQFGTVLRSGHGLATAVLVALPYRWFGVRGAKAAMCVWTALLVSLVYRVLLSITGARRWSLATALVLALSLPYTMGAGQIYPDFTAGFLRLYLVYELARGFADPDRRVLRLLGYAAATATLPWLQHRHFPIAVICTAAFAIRVLHDLSADARPSRWTEVRAALRSKVLLAPLALMVGSQVLWIAYSLSVYGALVYPGQPRFLGWYAVMIAIGLHLDQFHGLFFQNPLLFAALAGLPVFIRRTPRVFAIWALIYGLTVVPMCTQHFGYGAWSFAGRYQWDLTPLWIFPLAHFIAWLFRRRGGATAWGGALAAAVVAQVWFARRWIPNDGFLIQPWTSSAWMLDSFYRDLRWFLPVFTDVDRLLTDPANWLWVGLALIVACGTLLVRTRRSAIAGLCAAGALIALLVVSPRAATPLQLRGMGLFSAAGHAEGLTRVATAGRDAPGFILFGPYITLGSGCYEAILFYDADAPDTGSVAHWETVERGRVLATGELSGAPTGARLHKLVHVPPGERMTKFEFRVWYNGSGRIRLQLLTIEPVTCPGAVT